MFLEITSRSSKVLQPYQRLASVTLNMETDLKTKLAYERIYSHTILNILCGTINKNMYHLLQLDQTQCILSICVHFS